MVHHYSDQRRLRIHSKHDLPWRHQVTVREIDVLRHYMDVPELGCE